MAERRQHDITASMQRRTSGLLVPEGSQPEHCPHPEEEIDHRRHSYFCRRCQEKVTLVTVGTRYMTSREFFEFRAAMTQQQKKLPPK